MAPAVGAGGRNGMTEPCGKIPAKLYEKCCQGPRVASFVEEDALAGHHREGRPAEGLMYFCNRHPSPPDRLTELTAKMNCENELSKLFAFC